MRSVHNCHAHLCGLGRNWPRARFGFCLCVIVTALSYHIGSVASDINTFAGKQARRFANGLYGYSDSCACPAFCTGRADSTDDDNQERQ